MSEEDCTHEYGDTRFACPLCRFAKEEVEVAKHGRREGSGEMSDDQAVTKP